MKTTGIVLDPEVSVDLEPGVVTLYDRSRFRNNGVFANVTWVQLPSGLWVMSFNGTNSSVDLTTNSIYNFTSELFTVEAWIYLDAAWSAAASVLFKGNHGGDGWFLSLGFGGGTNLELATNHAPTWEYSYSTALNKSQWYHGVAVRTSTTNVDIYINGVDDTASHAVHADPTTTIQRLAIGTRSNLVANPFYGLIAQPRIYTYALSAATIYSHFQAKRGWFGV